MLILNTKVLSWGNSRCEEPEGWKGVGPGGRLVEDGHAKVFIAMFHICETWREMCKNFIGSF